MKHLNYFIIGILLCIAVYIGVFIGRNSMTNTIDVSNTVQTDSIVQRINMNTATMDELYTLPGIGKNLAKEIITYREKYGKYVHVDELLEVNGMTQEILDSIKSFIDVN